MSVDEFFVWQERQEDRYELVDGIPLRMMAGASNTHDDITVNLIALLRDQLRGSGCRPFTGDGSVQTRPRRVRRPDVGVDCGRRRPGVYKAEAPRMVAEILSPSTRDFDVYAKVDEYKGVPGLDYILLIEPNAPEAVMWVRDGEQWRTERAEGPGATLSLPLIGVTLALDDLYADVEFPAGPRLAFGRLPDTEA